MSARPRMLWQNLRASLWFTPALIILGGLALALAMIRLDEYVGDDALARMPRLFGASADGARSLLEAVATSMVTVAGVAFSITIVVLGLASSQYSSRVLRHFMRNRVNQTVLGGLMAIFVYCLIVLRTIRGGEEAFIPSISILAAIALAFIGIGLFVYYIHHTASSIQASRILALLAEDTRRAIDACFDGDLTEPASSPSLPSLPPRWYMLPAQQTGYIQSVDIGRLVDFAQNRRVLLRMEAGVGDFVIEGMPLLSMAPPAEKHRADGEADEDVESLLDETFAIGVQRTVEQDPAFGLREIVDVALRALSPSLNDTTTAQMCLDHLCALLARVSHRRIECPLHFEDEQLRVVACGPTFERLVRLAFDQIRENGRGNAALLEHLLGAIETLAGHTRYPPRRRVLLEQASAVRSVIGESPLSAYDRDCLLSRATRIIERLHGAWTKPAAGELP